MRKPPTLANGDKEIPSGLSLHLGFDHRTLQHAVSGDAGGKRRDISFRVRRFAHIARGLLELVQRNVEEGAAGFWPAMADFRTKGSEITFGPCDAAFAGLGPEWLPMPTVLRAR
jgi:hypothetical protein